MPDLAREAGRGFALVVAGQGTADGDGPGAGGIVGRGRGAVGHARKPRDAPRPWQCTLRRARDQHPWTASQQSVRIERSRDAHRLGACLHGVSTSLDTNGKLGVSRSEEHTYEIQTL